MKREIKTKHAIKLINGMTVQMNVETQSFCSVPWAVYAQLKYFQFLALFFLHKFHELINLFITQSVKMHGKMSFENVINKTKECVECQF